MKQKIIQALIVLSTLFGLVVGFIAFLLNLVMQAGDAGKVVLIAILSSMIAFIFTIAIFVRGLQKLMKGKMGSFPGPNPFDFQNKE